MNNKLGKKVSSLALGSSMLILSMLPAASAFAASAPTLSLSEEGHQIAAQVSPGGQVTFTATSTGVNNPRYQFWVEEPNGSWIVAQNYSSSNTFTLKNVTSGDYLVTAYVLSAAQLSTGDYSAATNVGSDGLQQVDGVFVDSSVTLSAQSATVTAGQYVTVTATATNIYDPLYQFWYETPSGVWEQSGNYTASGTYTFKAPTTGTYNIIAYAKSPLALNDPEGALYSKTVTEKAVNAVSSVTISGTNDFAAGNSTTLTATAMESGSAITSPSSVSWTVTSSNGVVSDVAFSAPGSTTTTFNVPASDPGTYLVTATIDGVTSAPYKVIAYGQASALTQSATKTTVVADGKDLDTITATVTDANGNTVSNYNGTATIVISGSAVSLATGSGQASDVSGSTVTFSGGVATFVVQASTTPGVSATVSVTGLTAASGTTQSSSITYGSGVSISTVPQSATSIAVTPASKTLSVNQNAQSDVVTITVDDQAGYPMLGGTYQLNATVSGGASFTGSATTETLYAAGDPATTALTVYGAQGVTGTYVVSVSGAGLTTGVADISAVITGLPADLTATDSTPSFTEGSATGTTITLGATDASGDTVSLPSTVIPEVTITNASGVAVTGLTVSGTAGQSATMSGSTYVLPAGTSGLVITDTSGKADAGTYTVTIKDGESTKPLAATSLTITELAAPASTFTLTPQTNVLTASNLSTTLNIQVTDAYGNPVTDQNVPITLKATGTSGSAAFNGGSYSQTPTVTVNTNAAGAATVTFSAEDYTSTWTITASVPSSSNLTAPAAVNVYVQNHPAASYAFKLEDTSSGTYQDNTTYAQAGNTVIITPALANAGLDANDNSVSSSVDGTDNVTVSIDHASGLQGLPTTSTSSVTVTVNSGTDTETLSGTLSNVSALLAGSTLTAGKAGEVTVAIQDNSTGASGSASIDIVASTTPAALAISGLTNNEVLTTGTTYPVTVTLVDAGGNPIITSASETVNLSASSGLTIENGSGVPITSVTIDAGQSSASFTVVTDETAMATSGSVTATTTIGGTTYSGEVTGLSD
ncbi:beta strand repeat-containing protein [Sulfobacillus thermosulfidooxidans]|uniref:beta strand repeat-containing protein n=1 Tax=Sulfobacillus thermosulfidooxidans TaxID=28034 RepID=UPI00048EC557|nr:hypothetical protein [Sulfobacillus thermosulfidooxidans]